MSTMSAPQICPWPIPLTALIFCTEKEVWRMITFCDKNDTSLEVLSEFNGFCQSVFEKIREIVNFLNKSGKTESTGAQPTTGMRMLLKELQKMRELILNAIND